ncbi:bifunctional [glutamine synthetase] adenylyltransferase/[glutamine synthetase]-adenylyl-L-tyrosine phosphorylase [Oceaniglobus roseus]|uniref:bifunctional [glutamine synthetase] adenylyltransferase/[glutamine synthetase]-adenylyl-L-tyrosine phosphorylase n=1 Tax=Oceaniglobus roseus TaxID=1737570 RepID=UPI000C7E8BDE|nr:bifunctional [glutamine synthetase] adenylyltransferase/[glutamine synthetase]-adenylyl-L-tyrosine phosphorylase [Kandeliimicrobium roseum]
MTFAARMTRCPRPFETDRRPEAAPLEALAPELADLLEGAAGCSPFLKGAMEREAEWLAEALSVAPEAAFAGILDDMQALEDGQLAAGLRVAKRRTALLTGLADLAGVWRLEEVTGALTAFADLAVARALASTVAAEIRRKKLPGLTEDDIATAGGMVVLAMGKMGAGELNYSSDIDLICLFDESRFDPAELMTARAGFVRATQRMCALLSDRSAEGYVFRTDLRLRPDPSVTPVCVGMEAAERYYESLGRTWERAAHIKARPSAGDVIAGEAYLERLRPFIWRRHLDFAAIKDAHDMRLRIRAHKGLNGRPALEGYDLKLGRGGIREIEFFTQTRQIIAGGRDPSLRVRGTCEGLDRLVAAGWVQGGTAEQLKADYVEHRTVEHRVQMVNDAQTHALPQDGEGFARLAAMMDRDTEALRDEIEARLERVAGLTEPFFDPAHESRDGQEPSEPPELDEKQAAIVARWRGYPALRSQRAQEIFDRLRPDLLARLSESADPEQALLHLDGFLAGLPAGVQLFSLFEANPQLIDLIVDIADTAPDLARFLSRNAGVFDAVIGGTFFTPWPGPEALREDLEARLADAADYEARLDLARAWAKEWKFRIGVHHLRGLIGADAAGRQYADVADAVLGVLWPLVGAHFAERHGAAPGRGAMVLGMGSLGAGRLNAASDLDLIVIYDADGVEASEGKRPLASRLYYARLTQALVTALSAAMAEGKLYEVDMRLRPSGRQGPVATALPAFRTYQREEAWTWEHLALTRARAVAGAAELCDAVESFRLELLAAPREAAPVLKDVADMRDRLAAAQGASGPFDAKAGPGRLQDIELAASAAALLAGCPSRAVPEQLEAGAAAGVLPAHVAQDLAEAHGAFWRLHAAARLLSPGRLAPDHLGAGGAALLLRDSGAETLEELAAAMAELAGKAAAHVAEMLGSAADRA